MKIFSKIKEMTKKVLLTILSATTVGSGLAATLSIPVFAADDEWELHMDTEVWIQFHWVSADGKVKTNNTSEELGSYRVRTFRLHNDNASPKNKLVFCLQQGIWTDNGQKYTQDYENATSYWNDISDLYKNRIRLAVEWYKNSDYYSSNGQINKFDTVDANNKSIDYRVAVQIYIWEQMNNATIGGGKDGHLETDKMFNANNPTGEKWQRDEIKEGYDMVVAYVNSHINEYTTPVLVSPKFDRTNIKLNPGEKITITDKNNIVSPTNYKIVTNLPDGITASIKNNQITLAVANDYNGIFNQKILVQKTSNCKVPTNTQEQLDLLFGYKRSGHNSDVQVLGFPGSATKTYECSDPEVDITLKVEGGKIRVEKADSETGEALADTTFDIINDEGNVVQTLTTNHEGWAESNYLPYGDYIVKETKAPVGYNISIPTSKSIKVNSATTTVKFTDKEINAPIRAIKIDEEHPDVKLENTVFEIYQTVNKNGTISDTKVAEITTNQDGIAVSELLEYGDYYLIEKSAPYGYFNKRIRYPFEIREEKSLEDSDIIEIIVTNPQVTPEIKVTKYDSNKDGNGVDKNGNKLTLEGAEFELWEHIVLRDVAGHILQETDAKIAGPIKTDINGEAKFTNKLSYSNELQQTGSYYYIKEVKAPDGYKLNTEEHKITYSYQGQDVPVVKMQTIFEDDYIPGKIKVIKEDKENSSIKLASAVFEVRDDEGTLIDTLTTDKNGEAITRDLRAGTYTVTEIKAPDNYQKDSTPQTITLSAEKVNNEDDYIVKTQTAIFKNTHNKGILTLTKVDDATVEHEFACTNSNNPSTCKDVVNTTEQTLFLPNVEFTIYSQNDTLKSIITGKTDVNGKINFTLNTGKYYYQETKTVEGYNTKADLIPFELTYNGETVENIVTNTSLYGSLKVHKIGESLVDAKKREDGTTELIWENTFKADTEFELYAEEEIIHPITEEILYEKDELVETIVTDSTGEAGITDLPLGKYYVKETIAPEEHSVYETTSDVKYIELTEKEADFDGVINSEATFVNEHLIIDPTIYKVGAKLNNINDESEGHYNIPLEGVKFGIYNAEEIVIDNEEKTIINPDTLLATMITNSEGRADVQTKLPFGKYYLKELETVEGYYLDETKYDFELVWSQELQKNKVLVVEVSDKENPFINYEIPMPKTGTKVQQYAALGICTLVISGLAILLINKKKKN